MRTLLSPSLCSSGERWTQRSAIERRLDGPTVTVIVPTFNCAETIGVSLKSLVSQKFSDIEILVVDDASTDSTRDRVLAYCRDDSRIRLLKSERNRGPYWCKNLGLQEARGEFVTFQDADDVSDVKRIGDQVEAMRRNWGAVVVSVEYRRVDAAGQTVLNRGRISRRSYQSLMLRRSVVLSRIGFFDSVRFAADDEFWNRLIATFPRSSLVDLRRPLYDALVRNQSLSGGEVALSGDDVTSIGKEGVSAGPADLWHLSPTRRAYVHAYREWHERSRFPFMPFPLRARPFPVPPEMDLCSTAALSRHGVTASVASFPPRMSGLCLVVRQLLPQVDRLYVHLNGYSQLPKFLNHPRISVTRSDDYGDLKDNGKYVQASEFSKVAHLTLDDDLHYPSDYAAKLLAKLFQYESGVMTSLHGTIYSRSVTDAIRSRDRKIYHFRDGLYQDVLVHQGGTGVASYSPGKFPIGLRDLGRPGMVDIWVARLAQRRGVRIVSPQRSPCFVTPNNEYNELASTSLYAHGLRDSSYQTRLVMEYQPWLVG